MKGLKKVAAVVSLAFVLMSVGASATARAGTTEAPGNSSQGTVEAPGVVAADSGVADSPGFIEAVLFMATLIM